MAKRAVWQEVIDNPAPDNVRLMIAESRTPDYCRATDEDTKELVIIQPCRQTNEGTIHIMTKPHVAKMSRWRVFWIRFWRTFNR